MSETTTALCFDKDVSTSVRQLYLYALSLPYTHRRSKTGEVIVKYSGDDFGKLLFKAAELLEAAESEHKK